jgi:hypothetical protein
MYSTVCTLSLLPGGAAKAERSHAHACVQVDLASRNVTTIAGTATAYADGMGTDASFTNPYSLTVGPGGTDLFVTERSSHTVRKVATRH